MPAGSGLHEIIEPLADGLPDWRHPSAYRALYSADRSLFAWEWLRRTGAYRQAWRERRTTADPLTFGLERFEDPAIGAPRARPIWSASVDPMVIKAKVHNLVAGRADRIDLLERRQLVSVAIDADQVEHLLFADGLRLLRIDILEGTLIGCPAGLRYLLDGIEALEGPLTAVDRLIGLSRTGRLDLPASRPRKLPARWVLELRVHDALLRGADQQEIARGLYGDVVPQPWRETDGSYRLRVQRLARVARRRLAMPLDPFWFSAY